MRKSMFIGYKGNVEAYIYIWFSKSTRLVYVGETNNVNGVIGRANQHVIKNRGTLYNRVYDKGYNLYEIEDFVLLSYPLPREKRYTSEETSFRISVEYLVQKKLIENRINSKTSYELISNVDVGPHVGLAVVEQIANKIAEDFGEIYNENTDDT